MRKVQEIRLAPFRFCMYASPCPDKKVSDVYLEVGFKNLSHFSRVFKQRFGYAPTGKMFLTAKKLEP
jgi:AraC-like DNA-binding protein